MLIFINKMWWRMQEVSEDGGSRSIVSSICLGGSRSESHSSAMKGECSLTLFCFVKDSPTLKEKWVGGSTKEVQG